MLQRIFELISDLKSSKIFRNIVLVAGLSFAIKLVAFGKESLVASQFGLSLTLDTFYIAILIPSFIQNVFIGALKNLFIPNYIAELRTSEKTDSFQSYTFILINILVFALTILSLIFVWGFLEMVFPNHDPGYYELVRHQFYIVLPCILLWGYSGFVSGLLEIHNRFFESTISDLFIPVVTIILMVVFRERFDYTALSWGITLGSLFSLCYLVFVARKKEVLKFGPPKLNENIQIMIQQYLPKVSSGFMTGINEFVDQFFAAQLIVGSIAAINYGLKVPAFVLGILVLAIGNVLLPHFSELINQNLEKAFKNLFHILKIVFSATVPIIVIAIFLSEDLIRILFERNEFTPNDTIVVGNIQKIILLYVPFNLCSRICVKFLTALNKNVFMAWVSFVNMLLNVILNIILMKYLKVYGLVLSTTIVYITSSIIYFIYVLKLYKLNSAKTIGTT